MKGWMSAKQSRQANLREESFYSPVAVDHLRRNVARVGGGQEHHTSGDLHRLL